MTQISDNYVGLRSFSIAVIVMSLFKICQIIWPLLVEDGPTGGLAPGRAWNLRVVCVEASWLVPTSDWSADGLW